MVKNLSRLLAILFVMLCVSGFPQLMRAAPDCDDKIEAASRAAAQNGLEAERRRIAAIFGEANSFDSLYCGAQLSSGFDAISRQFAGNFIMGLVRNAIKNIANQACQAAVAPIQNAASKLCVPAFDISSLFNVGNLFGNLNKGSCNGFQLLKVSPVTSPPSGPNGGVRPYVPLSSPPL